MGRKFISQTVLTRLPAYLGYLKSLPKDTLSNISATTIAKALNMGEVQVRKDLASVCDGGKPKIGYVISNLISDLESFLGYHNIDDAIIVGAGKLGSALLRYNGFNDVGINITAAFDIDEKIAGMTIAGKQVLPVSELCDFCKQMQIRIGIITVPVEQAQNVCDLMIESGILAIMNFAPTHLNTSGDILIQTENIASSLALLSKNLAEKL